MESTQQRKYKANKKNYVFVLILKLCFTSLLLLSIL